jgi:hypothetical protein
MTDIEGLTAADFGLDRPAYPVHELLSAKLVPYGRTKFYEKVKAGEIEVVKDGAQSLVMTPVLVKLFKKLMADSAADKAAA